MKQVKAVVFAVVLIVAVLGMGCSSHRMLMVSPEIGNVMSVASTEKDEMCPAVTPDGERVAYAALRQKADGKWSFDIMAKSSRGEYVEQQIIASPDDEYSPAWYPDGKNLVFTTFRTDRSFIQKISGEGSYSIVELTRAENAFDARVSPDGEGLVFVEAMNYFSSGERQIKKAEPQIVMMREDGTRRTIIVPGIDPALSPDGKKLAFSKLVDGHWRIHICNLDGTDLRMLQTSPYNYSCDDVKPAWAPSGRSMVFASNRNKVRKYNQIWKIWKIWDIIVGERQWDLYKIDVETGSYLTQLTRDPNNEFWPSWGTKGQIFFQTDFKGNWDIYSVVLK